jgi:mannosyl-oligosaccharide alpha-1,2-mannosidase
VNFSSSIDFSESKTSDTVSVFETTIRYLGGLLSAYELSGKKFPALLSQAQKLGDKLAYAWYASLIFGLVVLYLINLRVGVSVLIPYDFYILIMQDNDIPFGFLDFSTNTPVQDTVCFTTDYQFY